MRATSGLTAGVALVAGVGAVDTVQAADWSISARTQMLFDNIGERDTDSDIGNITQSFLDDEINPGYQDALDDPTAGFELVSTSISKESTESIFGLNGLSITAPLTSKLEMTVSALYADMPLDFQTLNETQILRFRTNGRETTDVFSTTTNKMSEVTRYDVEATFQWRNDTRNEGRLSYLGGIRMEHLEETATLFASTHNSRNYWDLYLDEAGLDPTEPEDRDGFEFEISNTKSTYDVYSGRFGFAAIIDDSDTSLFYVNLMGFVSHEINTRTEMVEDEAVSEVEYKEWAVGPDVSVGYMQRLGDRFAFDMRYRTIASMRVDGEDYEDPRITHGLSLGVTLWF